MFSVQVVVYVCAAATYVSLLVWMALKTQVIFRIIPLWSADPPVEVNVFVALQASINN